MRTLSIGTLSSSADFHCASEYGDFAFGVDDDAGGGSSRRASRFLNAREAFADFYSGL